LIKISLIDEGLNKQVVTPKALKLSWSQTLKVIIGHHHLSIHFHQHIMTLASENCGLMIALN